MNKTAFSADMKKICRDPILMLFLCVPVLAAAAFKTLLIYGIPLLAKYTDFSVQPYFGYIETFCLLLTPGMLGAVSAFMMIDERDGGIYELMSVTPLGYLGYITNRLMMPVALTMLYTIAFHFILNIYSAPLFILFTDVILFGMQNIIISLLLFSLADDKVKGLTLAKTMNIFLLTAAADLINIPAVSFVSALFPFYWSAKILMQPSLFTVAAGISVNLVWVGVAFKITSKNR